ncbi:MAG: DegT/DnrJ/EryC1/StrS family aminotransferase [Candidatus Sumerlaeaceae bacterium]|nr:DegT/DnrJ/EryC1/StrS family aminotransferase [Candidatus Sumerlaeaceae bacterium]
MGKVPFVDLGPQYTELKAETDAAIAEVIRTTAFINGKQVGEFEKALAESVGTKYCVGVANATSALWATMKALGIGPGDEVITTTHTAVCTTEAIALNGAKIVFCDIDPRTYQIDLDQVEAKITARTKLILPVHLYGIPVNMPRLLEISRKHNIPILEDCAQAQGAEVGGKRVGSMGIAACYSFFPSKNLGGMGDGGAMCTNDEKSAKFVRMFCNHGRLDKFNHEIAGCNERLDTLQAAILNVRLKRLDAWNAQRRRVATIYSEALSEVPQVVLPQAYPDTTPVWHLYVIRAKDRDGLAAYLKEQGIGTGLHYPLPLHLQPSMAFDYRKGDFPEAEKACSEMLSIPMYGHMTEDQALEVSKAVAAYYAKSPATVSA